MRINISENKVVDDWIFICEAIHALYDYGKRTAEHEIAMPENLVPMLTGLGNFVKVFEPYLETNGDIIAHAFVVENSSIESVTALICGSRFLKQ